MKPFEISTDSRRKLLDIEMRGFWDIATFKAFSAEFLSALHSLHRQGGCDAAIVDGREFAVQSREVLDGFSAMMRDAGPFLAKRTASLISGQLNKMQADHVAESMTRRTFTTREAAEAWLFDQDMSAV
jgi:hypothetical protein